MIGILWWFGMPWYVGRRDHRLKILRSLAATSPNGFEDLVADMFRERGYQQVHRSHSDPEEIRCVDRAGKSVLVRAKRLSPGRRVGSKELKRFTRELRAHHSAQRGVIVTTTTFTPTAFALARKSRIGLMEGRQLVHAIAAKEGDDDTFDRRLHEWQKPGWRGFRLIRIVVSAVLLTVLLALWIGPVMRIMRST